MHTKKKKTPIWKTIFKRFKNYLKTKKARRKEDT